MGKDIQVGEEPAKVAAIDADAIGFDIGFNLGDMSGASGLPTDGEGPYYNSQMRAGLTRHELEQVYVISGNHDRDDQPGASCGTWFRKWIDPLGENPATSTIDNSARPYPIEGTWDAYKVQMGNVVFLMIGDVNRPLTPMRGTLGGDPAGVVTPETYQWWKDQCAFYRNRNEVVITMAHYLPKETTVITGEYEGGTWDGTTYSQLFHGAGYSGGKCSSYLAYVGEEEGRPFIEWLEEHPGDCAMWFGGHNHVYPDKVLNGRGVIRELHGCHFVQAAHQTRIHHGAAKEVSPRSLFLVLKDGSRAVKLRTFMHTADYVNRGWYDDVQLILPKKVRLPQ